METIIHCDFCGNAHSRLLFEGRDRLHAREGCFPVVQCTSCGLIYLAQRPGPEEIGAYYPPDYLAFPTAIEDERSAWRRFDRAQGIRKRCRAVLRRSSRPGRLLDVGCATGLFLHAMHDLGWEAYGIEPSHTAAEYARRRFGLEVVEGTLEETDYPAAWFDLITFWDVLEHLPAPGEAVARASRLLRPGGWLLLNLPNPDAWERALFGPYWLGWDVPRHFQVFPLRTLAGYLAQAGFDRPVVESFTVRHGALVLSTQFWMSEWKVAPAIKRWILRAAASLPARMLTFPYFLVAERFHKTSFMTIYSQKKSL